MTKIKQTTNLLSFNKDSLFENLTEEDKKEMLSKCSLIYTNEVFQKVCDEIYTKEILNTISNAKTIEDLAEGRGKLFGIAGLLELIQSYHLQYLESIKVVDDFDAQEVI